MSPKLPTGSGGGGRVFTSVAMVVLVAAVMLLVVRSQPGPQPFDPRSGADDGATALVLLLEELGADVEVVRAVPRPGDGARLLVLDDRLDDGQRDDVARFVDGGGLAVVADPDSSLHGLSGADDEVVEGFSSFPGTRQDVQSEINVDKDRCTIAALTHLRGLFILDGVRFAAGSEASTCFGDADHAAVIAESRGSGTMVAVGDNSMFTNALIRFADNAGLAAALLAPEPGVEVQILLGGGAAKTAADIGTGERTLTDLVRPGVWMALAQLAVAFVLLAIARGVRAGRPVREPSAVPVAGSEFVTANGNLMQRAGHAERAGWLVRGHLYRELCDTFRLTPTVSIDVVDREVARRAGTPPGRVAAVLHREVTDSAGLLQLSRDVRELRTAIDPHTRADHDDEMVRQPEGASR
jgi:hypothetical protein